MATPQNRILAEIEQAMREAQNYSELASRSSPMKTGMEMSPTSRDRLQSEASNAMAKQQRLQDLLRLYNDPTGQGSSPNGTAWVNPFGDIGAGGSSSAGGTTTPTLNTTNRFEPGLTDAETRLRTLLDNPDSVRNTAAYGFRVQQGQEALERSLGAKGLLNSGNRLTELTKYGQDMGAQEYDAQFGRLQNLLGTYAPAWLGDKNANTALFSAQSGAWNTAQANADRNRLGWAALDWEKRKPSGGTVIRSSGGGDGNMSLRSFAQPTSDSWSYNMGSYDPNTGMSWYTNDLTGAQQSRKMG